MASVEKIGSNYYGLHASEPEALTEAIRGSRIDACLLARNQGDSCLERIFLPRICFDTAHLSSPMLVAGEMAAECFTMVYVTECPRNGHSFNFSTQHGAGYMGFFAPGGVMDAMTPAGYANAVLTTPKELFLREIFHRFPEIPGEWLKRGSARCIPQTSRRRIATLLEARAHLSHQDPDWLADEQARACFEEDLVNLYIDALHESHRNPEGACQGLRMRRYAAMRKIRDHIADRRGTPLRLDDLCAVSGMSRRGLEYLFKDHFGIGVNAFVRCQRLHGARRAIRDAHPEPGVVKRIALDWGFWHLGRFSAEYRQLFGECPSITVGRVG